MLRRLDQRGFVHSAGGQGGFALILVMVALVTLTILGVTAITAAQLDMKITQNMRHHKQLQYGAMAGMDHARQLAEDDTVNLLNVYTEASQASNNCLVDWIHPTAGGSVDTPLIITANTMTLSTYRVDVCQAVCNQPPAGTGVSNIAYAMDVLATGEMANASANARAGGFLFARTGLVESCNGLL